jgi:hypothetical protein
MTYKDKKKEKEYQHKHYLETKSKRQEKNRLWNPIKGDGWIVGREVIIGDAIFQIKKIEKTAWSRTFVLEWVK